MSNFEKCVDALCRMAVAEDSGAVEKARADIRNLMDTEVYQAAVRAKDAESLIRRFLLELGAPDHLIGHPYICRAIGLVIEDPLYINNISFGLYPKLAVEFDTTPQRVERAICRLVETVFDRCDFDTIVKYFGNTINRNKGKATNGEFIARIANVVKMQLKNAAE